MSDFYAKFLSKYISTEILNNYFSIGKFEFDTTKNGPDGKIFESDVTIAKNYLSKDEMEQLERIVSSNFKEGV